jgi:spermidine/putrescine transport system ATP-binding protein
MYRGRVQQVAAPAALYEYPANRFVADFIGTINMVEGRLSIDEPDHAAVTAPLVPAPIYLDHGVTGAPDTPVWVGIRPEKITMTPLAQGRPEGPAALPQANVVAGTIVRSAYLGSQTLYDVETGGGMVFKVARANGVRSLSPSLATGLPVGEQVFLSWAPGAPVVLLG